MRFSCQCLASSGNHMVRWGDGLSGIHLQMLPQLTKRIIDDPILATSVTFSHAKEGNSYCMCLNKIKEAYIPNSTLTKNSQEAWLLALSVYV